MKRVTIFGILLFALIVNAQPNYHERIIYYSDEDNACVGIVSADYIDLTINFNDTILVDIMQVSGHTGCT